MSTSRRQLAAEAWGALLRLHAELVPALDRRVRQQTGLPLNQYDVLLELANAADGKLQLNTLAEQVVLSRSRVSRLVDELVADGLVSKEGHPTDRRSAYAVLTEAGRARFQEAAPVYLAAIEELFAAGLSAADLKSLKRLLGDLR